MTDTVLTLSVTLSMVGFYLSFQGHFKFAYVGFIGLGLGLLAKGPLVLILVGLAIVPWLLVQHRRKLAFTESIRRMPWLSGFLLMSLIALPWYWMAEKATPGFLDYFILGEHFNRFIVSGWEGDLYGSAHDEPRGTIWLFWVIAAMPWSFVLLFLLWRQRRILKTIEQQSSGFLSFLIFWMISPLILFTFSGNILPTYVLPGLPALGLLVALLIKNVSSTPQWLPLSSSLTPVIMLLLVITLQSGSADRHSDKYLLQNTFGSLPVFYIGERPFSGQYYSAGQAKLVQGPVNFRNLQSIHIVGKAHKVNDFIGASKLHCELLYIARSKRGLYYCYA